MFEKVRDIIVDTLSCSIDDVTLEASLARLRQAEEGGGEEPDGPAGGTA